MFRPIVFNSKMVQAILEQRKTQSRRPLAQHWHNYLHAEDVLYVRETFAPLVDYPEWIVFRADYDPKDAAQLADTGVVEKWIPSIHLPKECSRIHLRVINIYPEPLTCMTNADAQAEGFKSLDDFRQTWQRIYPASQWDVDVVDVIRFSKICKR